jgi:epoxyqueuosine reductase
LAHNYYVPVPGWPAAGVARIARYAWGDDYHDVLGVKLAQLGLWLGERVADHQFKVTVDASPLAEKAFAVAAGAGWRGKHSLVVNPQLGSYFLIGTLLTTARLEPDLPLGEGCGDCTACLDACPTGALAAPGVLNAGRCISYTNEHGVGLGPDARLHGWLYGCDACQEACPYNASPLQTREPRFVPRAGVLDLTATDVLRMSSEEFQKRFGGSVVSQRTLGDLRAAAACLG